MKQFKTIYCPASMRKLQAYLENSYPLNDGENGKRRGRAPVMY